MTEQGSSEGKEKKKVTSSIIGAGTICYPNGNK